MKGVSSTPLTRPRLLWLFFSATALILGVVGAIQRAWVCDDAFISFRYARNLAEGRGLVFNAGERVEGFTNLLWTLLCAGAIRLGLDPVDFSQALGILFSGLTILTLALASWRRAPNHEPALPWAALGFAAMPHAQIFATSGLETSSFIFLSTVVVLAASRARSQGAWLWVGLCAGLLIASRPDGLLLAGVSGALSIMRARREGTRLPFRAWYKGFLAIMVPLVVLKLAWFGALIPNTFYAKSADRPYFSIGLHYLSLFFGGYRILAVGLVATSILAGLPGRSTDSTPARSLRAEPSIWLVSLLLYLAFVAWVGGDFMFARFIMPVVPLIFLGIEGLIRELPWAPGRPLLGLGMLLGVVSAQVPEEVLQGRGHVVEERLTYPPEEVERARALGASLRELFKGLEVRACAHGTQVMLAYYAEIPYVIEGFGLTDPEIARAEVATRGRPGHEHGVTESYLQEKGVHFIFAYRTPQEPSGYTRVELGPLNGWIVTYDAGLMSALSRRGVHFTEFELFLDEYLGGINEMDPMDVAADYMDFKAYYFRHTADPERQERFERWLRARGIAPMGPTP